MLLIDIAKTHLVSFLLYRTYTYNKNYLRTRAIPPNWSNEMFSDYGVLHVVDVGQNKFNFLKIVLNNNLKKY